MRDDLDVLLVAVDHYPHAPENDLLGSVADIDAMDRFLLAQGVDESNIRRLISTADDSYSGRIDALPTYENIVGELRALARRASPRGHVLVHYSGHGGQTSTLLPQTKGYRAVDECWVPCDLAAPGSRWLRDVELTFLLTEMLRRSLRVTLIIDACHSGGMMRGDRPWRRRQISSSSTRYRPQADSAVASLDELGRVWSQTHHHQTSSSLPPTPQRRAMRHVGSPASGWVAPRVLGQGGLTILAACRPRESALEYAIAGRYRGALTYCLLEVLESAVVETLDWSQVELEITAGLKRLAPKDAPSQTPVLEGGTSQLWFSPRQPSRNRFLVKDLDPERRRVLIGGGRAWGIHPGARFELGYTESGQPLAWLVEEAAAHESWLVTAADDLAGGEDSPIEIGDEARWISPGQPWQQKVVTAVVAGAPQGAGRPVGRVLRDGRPRAPKREEIRQGRKWLHQAFQRLGGFAVSAPQAPSAGETGDWRLVLDAEGCEIQRGDGSPVPGLPKAPVRDAHEAQRVAERVEHLCRFRHLDRLTHDDSSSTLFNKLALGLALLPKDFKLGDALEAKPLVTDRPPIDAGRWLALEVDFQGREALHLHVVALRWDWSVAWLYPRQGSRPLLEGRHRRLLPLPVRSSTDGRGGIEKLKVIATTEPMAMTEWELPSLVGPHRRRSADKPTEPALPWHGPIAKSQVGGPKFRRPERYWTCAEIELAVVP